jgi:hypothetical protein
MKLGKRLELDWFWCWSWGRSDFGAMTFVDIGPLMITWYTG